jgi:hypothetical protein
VLDCFNDLTAGELPPGSVVLDSFAGEGERLRNFAARRGWTLILIEIQPTLAGPACIIGDATALPLADASIDGYCTSVSYANGLSDKGLRMKNPRGRLTYDLAAGEPLHPNNTGAYGVRQGAAAYARYLDLHARAFAETFRVLRLGGPFLLNCSDCYQNSILRTITADNVRTAEAAGFVVEDRRKVATPRHRGVGANADVRADGEYVVKMRKPTAS